MLDISHLLFADDTLIFEGQIQITSVICVACSYVLKSSKASRSIWPSQNWFYT
jgi:hypothetical protein